MKIFTLRIYKSPQNIEMREKIWKFMPFWEIILDNNEKILGRYNQKYFTEQKIGEIIKKIMNKKLNKVTI